MRNEPARRRTLLRLAAQSLAASFALLSNQTALAAQIPGTLVYWGDQALSYVEPGTRFIQLAAGGLHNLALKPDGTVAAWGWNYDRQANVPGDLTNVVAVVAGYLHSLALKHDGTVVGWGRSDYERLSIPVGLSNVVALAAGGYHNLALKQDGTVVAWGYNGNGSGQATVPAALGNVAAIAAGENHNLALRKDGTLIAWGFNYYSQTTLALGLTNVVAVAARDHFLALRE